ncbi:hypothetical protein ACFLVR_04730 [Chloroflexota bacterium]
MDIDYKTNNREGLTRATEFYFDKADPLSILRLIFDTDIDNFEITALGENCEKLLDIYDRFIKPNIALEPCLMFNRPPVEEEGEEAMGGVFSKRVRSPNDDRSDSKNPNNPAQKASNDNKSNQMNPNNPAHQSSKGK